MSDALHVLAWGSLALLVYSYAIYPVVLALMASVWQLGRDLRFLGAKQDRRQDKPTVWPAVAIVIAAYNEERHIAERVRNLLELDYPADRLRIYIGSDGSRDGTAAILLGFKDERLRAHIADVNQGKASMLNALRSLVAEDIVVFSDANTFFDGQAVKRLVRWFDDPSVGGVSGELRLRASAGHNQDSLYWRMEQALKFFEGRIGALLGANGAIYAVRRTLWPVLKPDTICDDFCIGMGVSAAGQRLAYDPSAWAEEDTPDDIAEEYHRRLRIGVGNYQALFRHPEFLTRTSRATGFAYLSHKVLRWLGPHLILIGLMASLALAFTEPFWQALSLIELAGLALTGGCYAHSKRGGHVPKSLRLPTFFFALNWAFLQSSWRYLTGAQRGTWRRTAR
jgi:cellulose synthase/poly-beta-1,6-N-acetylglucosamine synthase-like glycosyltransferase